MRRKLARLLPRSVVARTSLGILVLALVIGVLFSAMSSWRVRAAEQERLIARVGELSETVQSTVSVACFLNDATLAKEIASGLMKNRILTGTPIQRASQVVTPPANGNGSRHRSNSAYWAKYRSRGNRGTNCTRSRSTPALMRNSLVL